VKRFREEREMGMLLAVDVSGSSGFGSGSRTKREFAAEIAATLAISATRSSDKVGLLLFSEKPELYLPPRKGRRHILRVLREMLMFEPAHRGTSIPAALTFLNHVLRRRAIVFLLSDFLETNASAGGPRATLDEIGLTNARHDLVCVHLNDPRETELPAVGLLTLEDAETGELIELDTNRAQTRERYAATNAERLLELDREFRRAGVDTLRFNTAESFAQTLQRFFETRRRRRHIR
jgi:uncharacterized protein (DUF58 family)